MAIKVANNEIQDLATKLAEMDLPRAVTFGDAIGRYVYIKLGLELSWLTINILSILIVHGHGKLTVSELANQMIRSPRSMTRLIDILEKERFVKRHRDKKDRRIVNILISPTGLDFMREYISIIKSDEEKLMSTLTDKERGSLKGIFQKLRVRLIEELREK